MPSPVIPSPNMSLPVPQVGIDTGPDWATQINNCLSLIDSHNHSPGQGVLIDQTGISLSGDLVFNTNSATFLFSTQFVSQGSTTSITNGLYVVGGNLWYNNGSATPVQITSGGSIVGSSGSISGLISPASASYNSGTDTFVWQSNAGPNAANMDFASATFRSTSSGSDGVTVNPPAVIPPGGYNLFLPTQPSSNNNFVTMNTDGTMNSNISVDGVTTQIVGTQLKSISPRGSPTVQTWGSSTTITTPAGATWARVRLIAGGGGGGGGGNASSGGNGTAGGDSSFTDGTNSCQATGGSGGTRSAGAQGGGGNGTVTGAVTILVGVYGSEGQGGITGYNGNGAGTGGSGGSSAFGGAGYGGVSGQAGGVANGFGSGGGGGGTGGGVAYYGGGGGAAGGYVEAIFYTLSSSYTLTIGSGGTGGAAGTNGFKGGSGGSGYAIMEFYYN